MTERPSDIPEDIWLNATKIVGGTVGTPIGKITMFEISEVIARNILNERERCARLVEQKFDKHGWNYHLPSVGREMAAAIRKGD